MGKGESAADTGRLFCFPCQQTLHQVLLVHRGQQGGHPGGEHLHEGGLVQAGEVPEHEILPHVLREAK
jgi:hypothetical protein